MRKLLLFSTLLFLASCSLKNEAPIVKNITKNWQFKGTDTLQWQTASVPGNVFSDLLNHNKIENPFILENEAKVQWVSTKKWEYQCDLKLSKEILEKEFIELNFEGLDTYAHIFLNDSLIAKTNNAFLKHSMAIKKIAKETNQLRIQFFPTDSIETQQSNLKYYKLPVLNRPFTRKAQFQYGWDWGPVLNTMGIWQPVNITAWNSVRFNDIYITNKNSTSKKANLVAEVSIESNADKYVFVKLKYEDKEIKKGIKVKKGISIHQFDFEIENPKLWWTHNLGKPNLYQFDFELIKNSSLKDTKTINYGIRTIELVSEMDSIGQSFYFKLNGKPIYSKGANVIPLHSFQNKVDTKAYQKLTDDIVKSNMNMVRVWGGGIYENDLFYQFCDAKGILVWQDFMFACAMYPGDTAFLENVAKEAEYQVKRLRNFASIALWCGNNENEEAWQNWGWKSGRGIEEMDEIWTSYQRVFDTILPAVVARNSKTSYWKSSPKYGRLDPKSKTTGDAHDWWVWHDAYPFEHFEKNVPRFMSEFGFQSLPSYEVLKYINQKDTVDLHTDAILSHQKHPRGFQLIKQYMQRDCKIPTTDEDYVYLSQLLQAKGIVMGIEAQRRAKPYNMGSLFWQLNDCWPAISWSSIDYFGTYKALQYKVKHAFANMLLTATSKNNKHEIYITNDAFTNQKGYLKLKLVDFYGKEIWATSKEIIVKANASEKVFELPKLNFNKTKTVLQMEFNNTKTNYYFCKPKELNLPKNTIEQKITKTKKGYTIKLQSTVLQKDVFLH